MVTAEGDLDRDGEGDLCDDDMDNDTWDNFGDNCPMASNEGQEDSDGDFVGDICDNCPMLSNAGQEDSDQDGKPGVSMGIVGYPFRIYVALKADVSFSAALYSQGTVWQGDAVLDVDTSILGDDIPFVNARNQFEASSQNREVISEFEGVTLLRIEEPGTTCENMVERSAFLTDGLEEQPPVGAPPGEGTAEELVGEDVWEEISETEGGVEENLPAAEEDPEPETEGASEEEGEEIPLDEESAP